MSEREPHAPLPPHQWPVLILEALAFGAILVLVGANDYLDLPHRLFGAPPTTFRLSEVVLEGCVILAFGLAVIAASWTSFRRLAYLESLITLCGSCEKVSIDGRWVRFETFLDEQDDVKTTHGFCPTCFEREMALVEQAGDAA